MTKDGYRVYDVFIDSRSYMLHRTGSIKPDQCPKLAIISTSSAFEELSDKFDELYGEENLLSIVTQDSFIEDGTNPSDRLLFIKQFVNLTIKRSWENLSELESRF